MISNDFLVLQDGLRENFASATVSVVDCPDLKQEPFMLTTSGEWAHQLRVECPVAIEHTRNSMLLIARWRLRLMSTRFL